MIGKMISNQTLRSRLKHSLPDTCRGKKRSVSDALFELLNYKTPLSKGMGSSAELKERTGEEVEVAQQRLLRK